MQDSKLSPLVEDSSVLLFIIPAELLERMHAKKLVLAAITFPIMFQETTGDQATRKQFESGRWRFFQLFFSNLHICDMRGSRLPWSKLAIHFCPLAQTKTVSVVHPHTCCALPYVQTSTRGRSGNLAALTYKLRYHRSREKLPFFFSLLKCFLSQRYSTAGCGSKCSGRLVLFLKGFLAEEMQECRTTLQF